MKTIVTAEPQRLMENRQTERRTFLAANVGAEPFELLRENEELGDGVPIVPNEKLAVDLASGEVLYAAAATDVPVRVVNWRAG